MTRPGVCLFLPRALAAFALLAGLAALGPTLRAQSTAATPNPAIFSNPSGSVVYAGNFRHYTEDGYALSHGYLALSLSPSGDVTGTLTWHGTKVTIPVKGKMDVATGQGHFSQRDANGKKLTDSVRIPFLVSQYGLTLNGGGTESNGDSTTFRLTKYYDGSGSYGDEGGGVLTLGGSNSFTGGSVINAGSVIANPVYGNSGSTTIPNLGSTTTTTGTGANLVNTGTLNLSNATGSIVIVVGTGTTALAVVDGNLVYNGSVWLTGPLTITTNSSGATVYTGTNASGTSLTITVMGAASTGG